MCIFLNIDETFIFTPVVTRKSNEKEKIPESVKQLLKSFYEPYNQQLFTLLGTVYNW